MNLDDDVHARVLRAFPDLMAGRWQYRGYTVHVTNRGMRYDLRFEAFIVDKLAFAKIEVPASELDQRRFDLADLVMSRLAEAERRLIEIRHRRLVAA
jgi:hypothetical protein